MRPLSHQTLFQTLQSSLPQMRRRNLRKPSLQQEPPSYPTSPALKNLPPTQNPTCPGATASASKPVSRQRQSKNSAANVSLTTQSKCPKATTAQKAQCPGAEYRS